MKPMKTTAQQFTELILRGIEAWIEAGKLAATEIERDPGWADEVAKLPPYLSPRTVKKFARIGRGQLHPLLAAPGPIGLQRLAKLPYQLQEKYLKQPVELLLPNGDTLLLDSHNLSLEQARQVFTKDDIRELPEQRAWIESRAAKNTTPPSRANLPYRTVRDELIVMHPCRIARRDIAKILADMQ
jgi:hypothetical protein